jgi:hypothetical protein
MLAPTPTHTTSFEFSNSLNQRPARSGTPCAACTPSNPPTCTIKPRLRLKAAARPVSPEPGPVRLIDNLLLPPSTSPAPHSAGTPLPRACPADLDEDELAGYQPYWHWPSPSVPPGSTGPDAADVLAPPESVPAAGVKRTWAEACADPAPAAPTAAHTAAIRSTPQNSHAKCQAPGAPDVRRGDFKLLASIEINVLAHLHGLFMAI